VGDVLSVSYQGRCLVLSDVADSVVMIVPLPER
jgi:hypothetical protein